MAAPGPSLNPDVAETVRATGWPVLVCQNAYELMPWADKLYGCDAKWWHAHNGTDFEGEKWSTHANGNDKLEVAEKYHVNLVSGCLNDEAGFSTDQSLIHYGNNSGYQAINLAILLGSPYIVLVGFNMSRPGGKGHFFGDYKDLHNQPEYEKWVPQFDRAARLLEGTAIVNATPDSAIDCFPKMTLEEAIDGFHPQMPDMQEKVRC